MQSASVRRVCVVRVRGPAHAGGHQRSLAESARGRWRRTTVLRGERLGREERGGRGTGPVPAPRLTAFGGKMARSEL